jgi:hypothetical protein
LPLWRFLISFVLLCHISTALISPNPSLYGSLPPPSGLHSRLQRQDADFRTPLEVPRTVSRADKLDVAVDQAEASAASPKQLANSRVKRQYGNICCSTDCTAIGSNDCWDCGGEQCGSQCFTCLNPATSTGLKPSPPGATGTATVNVTSNADPAPKKNETISDGSASGPEGNDEEDEPEDKLSALTEIFAFIAKALASMQQAASDTSSRG